MSQLPVKGTADILAVLSALPKRVETQVLRQGMTAMAKPIRDEARSRASFAPKMAKAIKTGSPRRLPNGNVSVSIRLDPRDEDAFLGVFFEWGVQPHLIARTGGGEGRVAVKAAGEGQGTVSLKAMKLGDDYVSGIIHHPGIAARPFLLPSLDTKATEAIEAFRAKIVAAVEKKTGFDIDAGADEAA